MSQIPRPSRSVSLMKRAHACVAVLLVVGVTVAAGPVKLNGPIVAGGSVLSYGLQFSPDSSRVL